MQATVGKESKRMADRANDASYESYKVANGIPERFGAVVESYKDLENTNKGAFDSGTYAKLKEAYDEFYSKEREESIIENAESRLKNIRSGYTDSIQALNAKLDKEIESIKINIDKGRFQMEKFDGIAKVFNSGNPGKEDIEDNAMSINQHSPAVHTLHRELKTDMLVLERLAKVSEALESGDRNKADGIFEKECTREALRADLLTTIQERKEFPEAKAEKPASREENAKESVNPVSVHAEGMVNKTWINHAKDYYEELQKWAQLDDEKKRRIDELMERLGSDRSMATATMLWKEINKNWLEKTDILDEQTRARMLKATLTVHTAEEAMVVSRESLAIYVNHYHDELYKYLETRQFIENQKGSDKTQRQILDEKELFEKYYDELNARLGAGNVNRRLGEQDMAAEQFSRPEDFYMWQYWYEITWAAYKNYAFAPKGRPAEGKVEMPPFRSPNDQAKEEELRQPPVAHPAAQAEDKKQALQPLAHPALEEERPDVTKAPPEIKMEEGQGAAL